MNPEALQKMDKETRAQYENIERDNKIRALENQALIDKLALNDKLNTLATKKELMVLKEELLAKVAFYKPKEARSKWDIFSWK